ncbi:hypothetical protein RIF29_31674 [Crotalaria pallida]|uniref:Mitochondrial phosphate carrier protein 1, mitochondrial n=1 Tax=Crotalaria pallida TaxID=3830 RepID=A0AAN9EPK1_CROPI
MYCYVVYMHGERLIMATLTLQEKFRHGIVICGWASCGVNEKLQDDFLQCIRYAVKPDEAYGLSFSRNNAVHFLSNKAEISMVMFSTFEHSVDFLYSNVVKRKKEDCSKVQQLGVTSLAGYAAGSVGSFVSNPADNVVSALYNKKADSLLLAIRKIGLANLFTRSLPIRMLLVGPSITLQWFFYDTIKILGGL